MKIKYFSLILSVAFLVVASPARADVVIGETCTQLGASQMTTDQEDIATCLKDGNELKWKGMTKSSAGSGYFCGRAISESSNYSWIATLGTKLEEGDIITCNPFSLDCIRTTAKCQGEDPVAKVNRRTYKVNCPDGYKLMKEIDGYSYGYNSGHGTGENAQHETANVYKAIFTCVSE